MCFIQPNQENLASQTSLRGFLFVCRVSSFAMGEGKGRGEGKGEDVCEAFQCNRSAENAASARQFGIQPTGFRFNLGKERKGKEGKGEDRKGKDTTEGYHEI